MQTWEYKVVNMEREFYSTDVHLKIESRLNELGKSGWELIGYVSFQTNLLAFKRAVAMERIDS